MSRSEDVDRILAAWFESRMRGDAPSPEELLLAHPDLEGPLRDGLEGLGLLAFSSGRSIRNVPEQIGDYRIVREIGRGGMGVVYEAEQVSMRRPVALKVLTPSLTGTAKAVRRFQREARAAGRLHHTNIVPVHGMGEELGHWYYAMELVRGRPLSDIVATLAKSPPDQRSSQGLAIVSESGDGKRPKSSAGPVDEVWFRRVAEVFCGVAEALEVAHDAGVVHRDVKPSNLLLDADGRLKIVDFGLAHLDSPGPSMTLTGDLVGTPAYMSPEQAMAKRIRLDHRTDIYSLGATMYEVLAMHPPFTGQSLQDLCTQIVTKDPQSLRRIDPRIPRDLETIVMKAMDKDRDRRYQHAGELARDLRRFADGEHIRARRVGIVERTWRKAKRHKLVAGLAAAALITAAVGTVFALRAADESARRERLEYDSLIARAEQLLPASWTQVIDGEFDAELAPGTTTRDLLAAAIASQPDWPDAYRLRALAPGRTLEERLQDVDKATAYGLAPASAAWLRAWLRASAAEPRDPPALPEERPDTPLDRVARAGLLARQGEAQAALTLLDDVVAGTPPDSAAYLLALQTRSGVRASAGDPAGALRDLEVLHARGDESFLNRVERAKLHDRIGDVDDAQAILASLDGGPGEDPAPATPARTASLARAWAVHGNALENAARFDDAARAFARALELELDDRQVSRARARCLHRSGAVGKALALFDRLVEEHPEDAALRIDRAAARAEAGELGGAIEDYREALRDDPSNASAWQALADLYANSGRPESALEFLADGLAANPDDPGLYHRRSRILESDDRLPEAIECASRAAELEPDLPELWSHLGRLQSLAGDTEAALSAFDRGLALAPERGDLIHDRGETLFRLGRFDESIRAYREALARGHEDSRWSLAVELAFLGRYQKALDEMAICAESGLTTERARLMRETSLRLTQNGATAPEPTAAERWAAHGRLLLEQNAAHDAVRSFEQAAAIEELGAEDLRCYGSALWNVGRQDESKAAIARSVERFDAYLADHPDDGLALARRAWALGMFEPVEELAKAAGRAAEHAPRSELERSEWATILDVLAWHLAGNAHLDTALAIYEAILAVEPTHDPSLQRRIPVLMSLGRGADAQTAARAALELAPERASLHAWLGHALPRDDAAEEYLRCYENALSLGLTDQDLLIRIFNRSNAEPRLKAAVSRRLLELHRGSSTRVEQNRRALRGALARSEAVLDNHEEACAAWAELARTDPEFLEFQSFADSLMVLGRYEEALRMLRAGLATGLPDLERAHAMRDAGRCLRALGHYREALTTLNTAAAARPDWSWEIRDEVARIVEREDRLRAIVESTEEPQLADDLVLAGTWAIHHERYSRAVELFRAAFTSDPAAVVDHGRRAASAAVHGILASGSDPALPGVDLAAASAEARAWLRDALQDLIDRPKSEDEEFREAHRTLKAWKADPALRRLRRGGASDLLTTDEQRAWQSLWAEVDETIARFEAESVEALTVRADALRVRGEYAESLKWYDAAVAACPEDQRDRLCSLQRKRSWALNGLGHRAEALEASEKAIALWPEDLGAYFRALDLRWRVFLLLGFDRFDEAEAAANLAVEVDPEGGLNHANVAEVLIARGRIDEAAPVLSRAIALLEKDPKLQRNGSARKKIEELVDALPADAPVRGELDAWIERQWLGAAQLGRRVAELERLVDRGRAELDAGRAARAIAEFERAVEVDPTAAKAFAWLGRARMAAGTRDAAIDAWREADRLDDGAFIQLAFALALREAGRYGESRDTYRAAKELAEQSGDAAQRHLDPLALRGEHPSDAWFAEAERLAAAEPALEAIVAGGADPADALECLDAATLAARRGDDDRAAALRTRALDLARGARDRLRDLRDDPRLAPVRDDPEWRALLGDA